jgi:dTDP-4-amino-4,6-dideoxygalactose transaminase
VGSGPKVARFEQMFAEYVGVRHAIAVSSCTAALHLAAIAAGIGPGDEVILPSLTFAATANAVIHTGATPVFVDSERTSMNIDPALVRAALTPKTRAIMPVDFAGRPIAYDELLAIAREYGLRILEDAAHCIEGTYRGAKVGTISDATCFSFYVTKNITTIEGGMITTDRDDWAATMRTAALHGMTADAWARFSDAGFKHYEVISPGYKYNMTDVSAAVGIHQLPRVTDWLNRRREIWERYDAAFADLPLTTPAAPESDTTHARHLYTVLVDVDLLRATRDQVLDAIQAEGVGCGVHYVALHLHRYFREQFKLCPGDFPNATYVSERTVSLPLSPKLTDDDVEDVIAAVRKVMTALRK